MKPMILTAACAVICAAAGGASAETFTFVNTNSGNADQVLLRPANPDGRPMGAQVYGTKTSATFGDDKKAETAARCSTWILPPDNQFGQSGVCEYKDGASPLYESRYTCTAPTKGATGVEMEALTAASVACLTIYDMAKAVDRGMRIEGVRLIEKRGGKSGVWRAEET